MTLLTALLAIMLIAASALPFGLPTEDLVEGPAERIDGTVLVAENRRLISRIYTLNHTVVSDIYQESRIQNGVESQIVRVATDGSEVYFIRMLGGNHEWQMMRLSQDGAELFGQGVFEDGLEVTGLSVCGEVAWITGIGSNGAIYVYEFSRDSGMKLKILIPLWWINDAQTAQYDGELIRVTRSYGEHLFMTPKGVKTYTQNAAQTPVPVISQQFSGWLLCKQNCLLAAAALWLVIAVSLVVTRWIVKRAERLAVRMVAVGGEVLFLTLLSVVAVVFYISLERSGISLALNLLGVTGSVVLGSWLIGVLVLWLVAGAITKPVARLKQQMNEIAEGNVIPREVYDGKDELHQMEQAMQGMCMGLSIRDYEMNSTIQSYRRFVPQKLTQLLERASVAEVSLGDNQRIVSNVGLFSVGNRDSARGVLEDGAFVDFINYSFGVFHGCVEDNHGCMISSALRLDCMETMFPNGAADGVRAGLDFLGRIQKKTGSDIPAPRPVLILHQASFLYGVAGKDSRLFPYVSSGELEFLGSYAQKFYETGMKIVATQSYWKQLESSGFTGRYIGFISDGDKNVYKLYEILDAYPELERKLRSGYDQRFQEAINLFYHNDFFLARNLFSTLLRACPEDGIVRWYLFACERFFNQSGEADVDYQLFAMEEDESRTAHL